MTNARDKANIPVLNFQSKGIDDNADATAITITSAEKVGIGNGNPQNNLDIATNGWDEGITIKTSGNTNNSIISDANRTSAGGGIQNFQGRWNGTEVTSILFQAGSDTTNKDDGEIVFRTASAGTPQERVKIHTNGVMSAANGIALGVGTANTASNVLDDYEEGTWTPGLTIGSSGNSGTYTKIGNLVTARFKVLPTASGSNVRITGLPFASTGATTGEQQGGSRETETSGKFYFIRVSNNSTEASIIRYDANVSVTASMTFEGNVTYLTT